jgi:flagellar basal-body rod protein FlgB
MINIEDRNDTSYNENGNNVDIDNEMSLMAENQIYNQALVDQLNNEFNSLKMVIRGGK